MMWPTWIVCVYGSVVALVAFWAGRRHRQREVDRELHRACDALDHHDKPCPFRFCYLRYTFVQGDPAQCIEGMEDWQPIAPRVAIIGLPGEVFECPEHGQFIPRDPPRYYPGEPEAKCTAWLPGGTTYCGRFCPPAKDAS